uniref:Uncharacterized protein n=1 Tax=Solanum tuberosum TaxID=4113 RepID=M1DGE2_SOLTU
MNASPMKGHEYLHETPRWCLPETCWRIGTVGFLVILDNGQRSWDERKENRALASLDMGQRLGKEKRRRKREVASWELVSGDWRSGWVVSDFFGVKLAGEEEDSGGFAGFRRHSFIKKSKEKKKQVVAW